MSTAYVQGPNADLPAARRALIEEMSQAVREQQNAIDAFDEAAAQALGLNRTDLRALDILQRLGPLPAGELATAAGVTRGAITGLVDRLEGAGFAHRVHDTQDRRRIFIALSDEGMQRALAVYAPIAERGWRSVEKYTDAELSLLRDVALESREFYVAQAARVRSLSAEPGQAEPTLPRQVEDASQLAVGQSG